MLENNAAADNSVVARCSMPLQFQKRIGSRLGVRIENPDGLPFGIIRNRVYDSIDSASVTKVPGRLMYINTMPAILVLAANAPICV